MADMTLAQLQALVEQQGAELAKLKAAAAATTPAPTEYYTLTKTGEEIDEILAGGGGGGVADAVRYDAAQTLTDDQKTQARGNIGAAPDGFGYGPLSLQITFWDDSDGSKLKTKLEDMYAKYRKTVIRIGLVDYPICKVAGNGGWADIYFGDDPNKKSIIVRYYTVTNVVVGPSVATLMCKDDVWGEWEYENHPMYLGVEYRTTERYLGKPVYVKAVDFGNAPASGSKTVSCATGVSKMVDFDLTVWNGTFAQKNTIINDDGTLVARPYIKLSAGTLDATLAVFADISTRTVDLVVKYTKTTG